MDRKFPEDGAGCNTTTRVFQAPFRGACNSQLGKPTLAVNHKIAGEMGGATLTET